MAIPSAAIATSATSTTDPSCKTPFSKDASFAYSSRQFVSPTNLSASSLRDSLRHHPIRIGYEGDSPALQVFLSQLGQASEGLIWQKHIVFACFEDHFNDYCDNFRNAVDLIKVCTALKTVAFEICPTELYDWSNEPRHWSITELLTELHLYDLAGCGHLTQVRFYVFESCAEELKGLKGTIKDFSRAFLELYGSAAAKRLDVGITDERGLIWVLEPQA